MGKAPGATEGVALGLGVAEGDGVADGVAEGVALGLGVALGVAEGVNEGDGEAECPSVLSTTAKACLAVKSTDAVMSMTPLAPLPLQSQCPKVWENVERAVP